MFLFSVSVLYVTDFHYLHAVLNLQTPLHMLGCSCLQWPSNVFFSPIEIYTRGMSLQAHQERTAAKNVFSGWYRAVLNSTAMIINHEKMV